MKTHEITTSKGEFVVDFVDETELALYKVFDNPKPKKVSNGLHLQPLFSLSEATDEDAKLIVTTHESESINTHLMKLHFILKSKGIDINNGNWYLFKKI